MKIHEVVRLKLSKKQLWNNLFKDFTLKQGQALLANSL